MLTIRFFKLVREQHPLKQGLRLLNSTTSFTFSPCQIATSIKTRIETPSQLASGSLCKVREQHPLKQGLRLSLVEIRDILVPSQRATSIKTRIETLQQMRTWQTLCSQRATSIKTRIETFFGSLNEPYPNLSESNIH